MSTRKQYSKEFKLDAISLVTDQGYTITEAARSLELNRSVLQRWIKWEFERIILAHGNLIEANAKAIAARAWRSVLDSH